MNAFRIPTRVHIEPGCSRRLPDVLAGRRAVLVVTDPGLVDLPWFRERTDALAAAGIGHELFAEIEANPRTTTAERAAEVARGAGLDAVVGIGGGSALGAAKAAAMLATNEPGVERYAGKGLYANDPLPFVAVPTTCGTGSEVTWVSVLTHIASATKISIKGDSMFPEAALVDADLIASLPGPLVASTGMDALTHAIEATTVTAANPVSDALAEKAIALLLAYLPRACADVGGDPEARESVMRAATLAGLAFGNSDVGGVHCLSETIGGIWDVPHGLCNAMLLLPVLRYHRPHVLHRLADLECVLAAGTDLAGVSAEDLADRFLGRVEALIRAVEIPPFASLSIPADEHPRIAAGAVANGSNASNPQPMAERDYLAVLGSA